MKSIDERVLDIEKSDSYTKSKHNYALRMNVAERVLATPDEEFNLITDKCVSLKINDDIKIEMRESNCDIDVTIYQNGFVASSFVYAEPYTPSCWREGKERETSHCELLRDKIKSIREIKLKVTAESTKYMSMKTKRFYAVFDAISGNVE